MMAFWAEVADFGIVLDVDHFHSFAVSVYSFCQMKFNEDRSEGKEKTKNVSK